MAPPLPRVLVPRQQPPRATAAFWQRRPGPSVGTKSDYAFELKWDGLRAIVSRNGDFRARSRRLSDAAARAALIAPAAALGAGYDEQAARQVGRSRPAIKNASLPDLTTNSSRFQSGCSKICSIPSVLEQLQ
jgi:hypothetical protein